VNIGSIQIAPASPFVVQWFGLEALKPAGAFNSRAELNAFLLLLNGALRTGEVGSPSLEAHQSGNQAANLPAPVGQNNRKNAMENANRPKDQRGLQRMVSNAAPEPVLLLAEARSLVSAPQLGTKHDASVVLEDRLASGFQPKFSATPPCPLGNIDTSAGRALPTTAPVESLADVAFALRISPKTGTFQRTAVAGPLNETPGRPVVAMVPPSAFTRSGLLTTGAPHSAAAATPLSSTANSNLEDPQVAGRSDSWFSAKPPCPVSNTDTRAVRTLPAGALVEPLADVAVTSRKSPIAGSSQPAAGGGEPNVTPSRPNLAMALTADASHAPAASIPDNSTANPIAADQPVAIHSDSLFIAAPLSSVGSGDTRAAHPPRLTRR
jgi:hypothetical protein